MDRALDEADLPSYNYALHPNCQRAAVATIWGRRLLLETDHDDAPFCDSCLQEAFVQSATAAYNLLEDKSLMHYFNFEPLGMKPYCTALTFLCVWIDRLSIVFGVRCPPYLPSPAVPVHGNAQAG